MIPLLGCPGLRGRCGAVHGAQRLTGFAQITYLFISNISLAAIVSTAISSPYIAILVIRTKSLEERNKMSIFRAIAMSASVSSFGSRAAGGPGASLTGWINGMTGLADTARPLGKTEEEHLWRLHTEALVNAFVAEYVTLAGCLVSEPQTALVLARHFHMAPEEHRECLVKMLVSNIEAHKPHLTTGFIGTTFACLALTDCGCHNVASKLLQEDSPSWLYEVKIGTTIWKRWNSILPDGSFNPANMNSLNHFHRQLAVYPAVRSEGCGTGLQGVCRQATVHQRHLPG